MRNTFFFDEVLTEACFHTGSLVDYLKTTEGSGSSMNTLIDMASQARALFNFLVLLPVPSVWP